MRNSKTPGFRLVGLRCCRDAAGRDAGVEPPPLPHRQRGGRHRRVARCAELRWCGAVVGQPAPPERGSSDRRPAARADADSSEPRGRAINNPGWFNIWVNGGGGWSTGLHQLMMDTLWFIDPDAGIDGRDPQLAGRRPSRIQRRLHRDDGEPARRHLLERRRAVHRRRRGLHRRNSDGHARDDLEWRTSRPRSRASRRRTTRPSISCSRPPTRGSIRSSRCAGTRAWIMPKHIFSGVEDVLELRLRQSGRPRALHAALLRPERHLVHLGEARGLGPHGRSPTSASRRRNTSSTATTCRSTIG